MSTAAQGRSEHSALVLLCRQHGLEPPRAGFHEHGVIDLMVGDVCVGLWITAESNVAGEAPLGNPTGWFVRPVGQEPEWRSTTDEAFDVIRHHLAPALPGAVVTLDGAPGREGPC